MNKYIIRATTAALGTIGMIAVLITDHSNCTLLNKAITLFHMAALACSITEFIICLICYHHALWSQDQTEQESQDGTK